MGVEHLPSGFNADSQLSRPHITPLLQNLDKLCPSPFIGNACVHLGWIESKLQHIDFIGADYEELISLPNTILGKTQDPVLKDCFLLLLKLNTVFKHHMHQVIRLVSI